VGSDNPVNKFMQSNRPLGATSEYKYLREFENDFENNLGYDSGVHMGFMIHENNKRPNISYYCAFKLNFCYSYKYTKWGSNFEVV
jgi:hypothetical protein